MFLQVTYPAGHTPASGGQFEQNCPRAGVQLQVSAKAFLASASPSTAINEPLKATSNARFKRPRRDSGRATRSATSLIRSSSQLDCIGPPVNNGLLLVLHIDW